MTENMESVAEETAATDAKAEENKAPALKPTPLCQFVALVDQDGVIRGVDLLWSQEVRHPQLGARVLNEVKAQLNDIGRTSEFVGRLLATQFQPDVTEG